MRGRERGVLGGALSPEKQVSSSSRINGFPSMAPSPLQGPLLHQGAPLPPLLCTLPFPPLFLQPLVSHCSMSLI